MEMEGAEYYLKPMNCPMHNLIFRSRGRSYRELPLRMFEFGTVYRYEKSGVVHGLTRVRGMTQDDAHIYCTQEQMAGELTSLLAFVLDLLRDYGLDDFYLELSTRNPEKSVGTDEDWERGHRGAAPGGRGVRAGAGARPGRRGVLRAEDLRAGQGRDRPDLADVDHPGRLQPAGAVRAGVPGRRRHPAAAGHDPPGAVRLDRAVLRRAHRALRGRVPGLAGAGAGGRHPDPRRTTRDYLTASSRRLRAEGIRAEVDASDDRMQKKIRTAQQQKIPFMVIAGDDDVAGGTVSFRYRDGSQRNGVPLAEAVAHVLDVVASRDQHRPLRRRGVA